MPICTSIHHLLILICMWKINNDKIISPVKVVCVGENNIGSRIHQGPFHGKWVPWKICSGLSTEYMIFYIRPYMGNNRREFPNSRCIQLFCISCTMVFLIPDMNWLDPDLKSSDISTPAVRYMYMSSLCNFVKIQLSVHFPSLFTPHDDIMGKMLKFNFINMQMIWVFIILFKTMVWHSCSKCFYIILNPIQLTRIVY